MSMVLEHPDGVVRVDELSGGRRRLEVTLGEPWAHITGPACETSYGLELVKAILAVKGPRSVCDEILREEDPGYVEHNLRWVTLPYVSEDELAGRRVLDFGCGAGASTAILARLIPTAEIVGVELEPDLLDLARRRAAHHGLERVHLYASPTGDRLPPDLGTFDVVFLSAVFEHLLPRERGPLLAQLFSTLRPGGLLFLAETPHRWNPVESHTTGLPLINYLPDRLTLAAARAFSPRVPPDESWETLLRRGVRGGSQREVLRLLRRVPDAVPTLLRPARLGISDAVGLWYALGRPTRKRRVLRAALRTANVVAGGGFVPYLTLAIRRDPLPIG